MSMDSKEMAGWLYRSHERVHNGLMQEFGAGYFVAHFHVLLFEGYVAIEFNEHDETCWDQKAKVELDIDEDYAKLAISSFRNDFTGDEMQIRGAILNKDSKGRQVTIEPDSGFPIDGLRLEVQKGRNYLSEAIIGENSQPIDNPNHELATAFFDVAGTELKGHI